MFIETQKKLFSYMKNKALKYEAGISHELEEYRESQEYYAQRDFSYSSMKKLFNSIHNSQVIYLGDFHTYDQNVRNLVRIIKSLLKNKSSMVIGLEMVHQKDQGQINSFLAGEITELEFLEGINYSESWRFPWSHYKIIFQYAKKFNIEIIALNSEGSLDKRDRYCAQIIFDYIKKYPRKKVLVLFGELHILPNKIPKELKILSGNKKVRQTIIHQNLDIPYWKIAEKKKKAINRVINYSESEFCLFSAPPWLKYESMCYWYESLIDDPEFDLHQYILEKGLKLFTGNTLENFSVLIDEIEKYLVLSKHKIADEEDFNLYDHSKLLYLTNYLESLEVENMKNFYNKLLLENQSFHILKSNILYCSNYSINKLSRLAGMYVFDKYRRYHLNDEENLPAYFFNENKIQFFIYFCYQKIFSYFLARVINPFLKCDHYQDIKAKLRLLNTESSQRVLYSHALSFLENKEIEIEKYHTFEHHILYDISIIVGEIYGDCLYLNIMEESTEGNNVLAKDIFDLAIDKNVFFDFLSKYIIKNNFFKMRKKRLF